MLVLRECPSVELFIRVIPFLRAPASLAQASICQMPETTLCPLRQRAVFGRSDAAFCFVFLFLGGRGEEGEGPNNNHLLKNISQRFGGNFPIFSRDLSF